MTRSLAIVLTTLAGGLVALQAPINSKLGKSIGTFPAATVSFAVGLALLAGITAVGGHIGSVTAARHVPWWYLLGGLLGAAYVSTVLVAVRSLGAGGVIAVTIAGQLAVAVVVDHFGWLGVERDPVDAVRVLGLVMLVAGVVLVVRD